MLILKSEASEKSRVPRDAEASAEAEPQHKTGGSHAQGGHAPRTYTQYSSNGRTPSGGDVRRTFNLHRGPRHQASHAPGSHSHRVYPSSTSPPAPPPPPKVTTSYVSTTTSNPNLYYFKAVDSTSSSNIKPPTSSSSTAYSTQVVENDNLALPGGYQPTYVVYPTTSKPVTSNPPNPTQYSSQKYLKPKKSSSTQFHPAGSYDAPKSTASKAPKQSIYREETAKFHPASLVHLPKVYL